MGLANNAQMLTLNAEKMKIPAIIYGDRKQVDPRRGWDLRNTKCVGPASFGKPNSQSETPEWIADTNPLFLLSSSHDQLKT